MNLILFDDKKRVDFFPFTHTRPMADIRCGILTMRKRWEMLLHLDRSSTLTISDLQAVFPLHLESDNLFVNGAVAATEELVSAILILKEQEALYSENGTLIAFRANEISGVMEQILAVAGGLSKVIFQSNLIQLQEVWDIFSLNAALIEKDFQLLTKNKKSEKIPDYVTAVNPEHIFIAPNSKLAPCIINASAGPVYIAEDAEIMEGCLVRGPFSLGEHATLKMGAKIYSGTTIGPHCKVGGEVNNAVFFNYSNKGHDGFIGNAVIGDWCNLGADTNCSNLKNNYEIVKIWKEHRSELVSTGLQFCGLLMGDHSKCGINTMFNTGTVVGVSCNIFGAGFPEKYIPSFTWGGVDENAKYRLDKAIETADRMMDRRGLALNLEEKRLWEKLYQK